MIGPKDDPYFEQMNRHDEERVKAREEKLAMAARYERTAISELENGRFIDYPRVLMNLQIAVALKELAK